ncbi:MAG: UDP-2,3-diacylglucosamine diphosphatase [Bacteroidales bacterium]|nr:UDP-2,3-diacylglucosamine diphosphatase [Bacteroidales bacterium]
MKNIETITLNPEKKIYFASDFHLGVPNTEESISREKRIIQWLDEISKDAQCVFLLGDIFDFWFEYNNVVPKGHVRLLGKLAEMADNGIDLRMFVGNHDLWTFGYLEKEIGMKIYHKPQLLNINEILCFVGHGDGLGWKNIRYKMVKKIMSWRLNQRLFAFLHPWIGVGLANFFSRKSRAKEGIKDVAFTSVEKESLCIFAKEFLQTNPDVTYFIFGHRHLPLDIKLSETTTLFNTGDWLNYDSYVVLTNDKVELKTKR